MSESPVTHWFKSMDRTWLVLICVNCTCGWHTRPCWSANGAACRFTLHLAACGTELIVP